MRTLLGMCSLCSLLLLLLPCYSVNFSEKGLVEKRGHPLRFRLTLEGKELASVLNESASDKNTNTSSSLSRSTVCIDIDHAISTLATTFDVFFQMRNLAICSFPPSILQEPLLRTRPLLPVNKINRNGRNILASPYLLSMSPVLRRSSRKRIRLRSRRFLSRRRPAAAHW